MWYRAGPGSKPVHQVVRLLPYIVFTLILLALYGYLLSTFVLDDFKLRAQTEGIMTVRAFTADVHHDKLNQYYKLPNEHGDGEQVDYPYKGDD